MSEEEGHVIDKDILYLLKPEITNVLAQGLSIMYNEKPNDPIDFLAKWLLKHSSVEAQRLTVHIIFRYRKVRRKR